jgi:hypothetical protein
MLGRQDGSPRGGSRGGRLPGLSGTIRSPARGRIGAGTGGGADARRRPVAPMAGVHVLVVLVGFYRGASRCLSPADMVMPPLGYLLNRSCPAQRVGLGRSDLAELNQRPGLMMFSYRNCSTYVIARMPPYHSAPAIVGQPAALTRRHRRVRRITPAGAGSSAGASSPSSRRSDHPRGCGEHCANDTNV